MTELIAYWPTTEHVAECLRTEAETVDQALLLAVHLPITLKRRSAQAGVEQDATESDLLEALLRPADDGSAVLIAVTGASESASRTWFAGWARNWIAIRSGPAWSWSPFPRRRASDVSWS